METSNKVIPNGTMLFSKIQIILPKNAILFFKVKDKIWDLDNIPYDISLMGVGTNILL